MSDVKSDTKKICVVVTLHGIGFEQRPCKDKNGKLLAGYADSLHRHLREQLHAKLGNDPNKQRAGNKPGAIYVESCWRDDDSEPSYEAGLKRLGTWSSDMRHVDYDKNATCSDSSCLISDEDYERGSRVSHVALVYSDLEKTTDEFGAALPVLRRSIFAANRYSTIWNLLKMIVRDIQAISRERSSLQGLSTSSLRPRRDISSKHERRERPATTPPTSGLLGLLKGIGQGVKGLCDTLQYLVNDVACYVYENDERHRVQSFVREALMRLSHREDVDSIVLNTHSNGTVIALDVLCQLSPEVSNKIKAFVTAGSPLRKYVTLFGWGARVECHYSFSPWYNFWDKYDPVADKIYRLADGPQGGKIDPEKSLFSWIAPNSELPIPLKVCDIPIDNIHNSYGGGLQAHNYWDNRDEFVSRLAEIVCNNLPTDEILSRSAA